MKAALCAFIIMFNLIPMFFVIMHLLTEDHVYSGAVCLIAFGSTLSLIINNLSEME